MNENSETEYIFGTKIPKLVKIIGFCGHFPVRKRSSAPSPGKILQQLTSSGNIFRSGALKLNCLAGFRMTDFLKAFASWLVFDTLDGVWKRNKKILYG